jgi:hypothetical protein
MHVLCKRKREVMYNVEIFHLSNWKDGGTINYAGETCGFGGRPSSVVDKIESGISLTSS